MSNINLSQRYIQRMIELPLPAQRPGAEHLACTVCGGSFRSTLTAVSHCTHCNGTGMAPKRFKIDLEKFCSHYPLPDYDREAMYRKFAHISI